MFDMMNIAGIKGAFGAADAARVALPLPLPGLPLLSGWRSFGIGDGGSGV